MVDRGNSNQASGSLGFRQRLEKDRISQLPDPLICQILSHLSTEDSLKTSVLATRWRSLWLWVPSLELDSREFPDLTSFMSFGERFFDSNRVSGLEKLWLTIRRSDDDDDNEEASHLTSWIDAAVKRKVQHLRVQCFRNSFGEMPVNLYVSETLISLRLINVRLDCAGFVSFPCLKTMHLAVVWFSNDVTLERLVSCCPVLEDLQIEGCLNVSPVYRVHSRSLKMLNFERAFALPINSVRGVVIDAPLLCSLIIFDNLSKSFIITNLEFNAKLDISLTFGLEGSDEASISSGISHIRLFLAGIAKVGDLTIRSETSKIIHHYSKSEALPQFGYMSRLTISLYAPNLEWLATFLESCPNLKSLFLIGCYCKELHSEEMNQIGFPSVPKCLLSSLEFVKIEFPFLGHVAEMKIVRFLLENSAVLKELTLHMDTHSTDEICKKVIEIPRASTKCEVIIVEEYRGSHVRFVLDRSIRLI